MLLFRTADHIGLFTGTHSGAVLDHIHELGPVLQAPLAEEVTALTRHGNCGSSGNLAGTARPPACEVIFDHPGMVAERVLELELARSASAELPRQRRASVRCQSAEPRSAEPQRPGMQPVAADTGAVRRGQAAPFTIDLAAGGSSHLGSQSVAADSGAFDLTQVAPVTNGIAIGDLPAARSSKDGGAADAQTVKQELKPQPAADSAGETACKGSTATEAKLLQGQREGVPESANGGAGQEGVLPPRTAVEPESLDIWSKPLTAGIDQGRQTVAAPVEVTDLCAAPHAAPAPLGNARRSDAQPEPSAKEGSIVPKGEQAGRDAQTPAEERISTAKGTGQEAAFTPDMKAGSLPPIPAAPKKQPVQIADGGGRQEMAYKAASTEASVARSFIPKLEVSASSAHPTEEAVTSASPSSSGSAVAPVAEAPHKPSTGSVSGSLTEPTRRRSRSSPDLQPPLQQVCRLPLPPSSFGMTNAPPGLKVMAANSAFAGHKAHDATAYHKAHDATAYLRLSHPQHSSRIPRPTANLTNRLPGTFREPSVAATADVPLQSGTLEHSVLATAGKGEPPTMPPRGSSKLESGAATTASRTPCPSLPAKQLTAASEPATLPQPAEAWPMLAGKLSALAEARGLSARLSAEVAQSTAAALPAPNAGASAIAVVAAAASTPPAEAEWKLSGQLPGSGKDIVDVTGSTPMQGWLLLGLAVRMAHNHVCLLIAWREYHHINLICSPTTWIFQIGMNLVCLPSAWRALSLQ